MSETTLYRLLADAVLLLHVVLVLFVVGGLVMVVVGNLFTWRWVNGLWFRLAHLGVIVTVVAESWFGFVCPLTSLEMWLRAKANGGTYAGRFVAHWLQLILYHDLPSWVFTVGYSAFGLAVLVTWWYFPPRLTRNSRDADS